MFTPTALLALIPAWWVTGLDVVVYSLAGLAFGWSAVRSHRLNGLEMTTLLLGGYLVLRSLMAGIIDDVPLDRLLAALNNVVVLLGGMGIGLAFRRATPEALHRMAPHMRRLAFIASGLAVGLWGLSHFIFTSEPEITLPTLAGLLLPPMKGLLANAQSLSLITTDWASGDTAPRVNILAPYPTASALILLLLTTLATVLNPTTSFRTRALLEALTAAAIAATLTRSVVAGYLLGTLAAIWFYTPSRWRVMMIFMALMGLPLLFTLDLSTLAEFRSASNETRTLNYQLAWDMVMTEAPVMGFGYRLMDESLLGIPLGSHSSVLAFTTKGGIVALALAALAFVVIPARWWLTTLTHPPVGFSRYALFSLMRAQVAMWVWVLVEDMDAVGLASTLIFITLACVYHTTEKPADVA